MIAILRSTAAHLEPDPVIFLAGGPGNETLYHASFGVQDYLDQALRHRDVILLDQRGMGFSQPSLNCPEVEALYAQSEIGSMADFNVQVVEAAERCHQRLTAEGVNIAAYNTVESAADVADIAEALGYEQFNLYAGSYGTTLAMTVMRNHPERLRSVMLTAVTPPQIDLMATFAPAFENTINMLFDACAADVACSSAFPQLEEMFYATVARLDAAPVPLSVTNPLGGAETTFLLDGAYFIRGIQSATYNAAFLPQFPLFVAAAYAEQYAPLENFVGGYLASATIGTEGANYAMRCMDDVMTTSEATWEESISTVHEAIQQAFRVDIALWSGLCKLWGPRQLDPVENTPLVSDIPTLLLNGAYDPVTPAEWGALAQETLANSTNLTFPADGHGVNSGRCSMRLYDDFLKDPTQALDASCVDEMPPVIFAMP